MVVTVNGTLNMQLTVISNFDHHLHSIIGFISVESFLCNQVAIRLTTVALPYVEFLLVGSASTFSSSSGSNTFFLVLLLGVLIKSRWQALTYDWRLPSGRTCGEDLTILRSTFWLIQRDKNVVDNGFGDSIYRDLMLQAPHVLLQMSYLNFKAKELDFIYWQCDLISWVCYLIEHRRRHHPACDFDLHRTPNSLF